MAGALEKSSEVMKYMQQLVKVPEIQATMQELSKEMMKVYTLHIACRYHYFNYYFLLKLVDNSSSLNKGSHDPDCDDLWIQCI